MAATGEVLAPTGSPVRSPETLYRKLSPGPGMPASMVASHQRARILAAMTELVGTVGFESVTLRELTNRAGVSTRTFYEHFGNGSTRGKDECLLLAHQAIVEQIATEVVAEGRGGHEWEEQLQLGFSIFLREIDRNPQAARLTLVETHALGRAALEQMRRTENVFEGLVGKSFSAPPDRPEMPPLLIKGIVAGTARVARARLLAGRERELPGLTDELLGWALSFDDEQATQIAQLTRRSDPRDLVADEPPAPADEAERVAGNVSEDERDLVLTAVTKLAAAEGYGYLTPSRIRRAAGVRRRSFDSHFEGVDDCFLAAVELRVSGALEYAAGLAVAADGDSWPMSVTRGMEALCVRIARDPVFAKLALVETYAAGLAGMRCRENIIDAIAERLRVSAPRSRRPSELAAEASASAVWSGIRHCVATGQTRQLPQLAPTLSFLALAPTIGAPAAIEEIGARHPSPSSKVGS